MLESRRRLGWLLVLTGGWLALALQVAAPVGVPLYDGVPVQEPYRYLHPTGDQPGSPTSAEATPAVTEGVSPAFGQATAEQPPQAQLVARRDAFEISSGATSIRVSITPIEPPPPPEGATIAGNAYRFTVTDEAGTPLRTKPCESCRTIVLRAPEGTVNGRIGSFVDGAWIDLATVHAGIGGLYQANVDALGDVAVIARPEGIDPTLIVLIAGIGLVLAAFVVLFYLRGRSPAVPAARVGSNREAGRRRTDRVPSKRRGSRRPPSWRSQQ